MKKNPSAMLLEANFDIDQTGETLEWRFSRTDGDGNPIEGRYAGGVYFTVGEKMFIRVKAGSKVKPDKKTPFQSFEVLDCCLISRPQICQSGPDVPIRYALPSPFVAGTPPGEIGTNLEAMGASINLAANKFKAREAKPHDPDYYQVTQVWDDHLTVGGALGRWELSFVITVSIMRTDGTSYPRVFCFDPEGEVGTGIVPS